MINLGREIVLGSDLLPSKVQDSCIPRPQKRPIGQRVEGIYETQDVLVRRDLPGRQVARTSRSRRNGGYLGDSLRLPQSFVITEDECAVLPDRPSSRAAKLIAAEGRLRPIEKISRIQRAVAYVFECVAMEIPSSGTCRSPDDSARGAAILCRVVARKNRKLLDRIRPEIHTQCAPRRTIHVVIDADSIKARVILPRTATGDRHLVTESPLCLACLLSTSAGDPGF